jgi:anti-sigma factor RsiW
MVGGNAQMNSDCKSVLEAIPGFATGSLESGEAGRVEGHLAACPSCRKALETERRLRRDLSGLPAQRCPRAVSDSVMAAIQSCGRPARAPWWRKVRLRPGILKPAFAAALMIATAIGLWEWTSPLLRRRAGYSEAEVKLADAALEWSLAFTANTIRQSEKQALEAVSADLSADAPSARPPGARLKTGGTVK